MNSTKQQETISDALPVVVVLGDFSHEGLTAKIESLGFMVINKRFRSLPPNWEKIVLLLKELNAEGRLAVVFGYLPTPTLLLVAEEQYDEVRPALMSELENVKTVFFVYEDNLLGIVEPLPWEIVDSEEDEDNDIPWRTIGNFKQQPDRQEWLGENEHLINRAMEILTEWTKLNIEVLPFRKRSDVTIRMFEALEDAQSGVFLRLYVPHGRYQSEQFEDFLTLFTRYLRDVEGKEFSVDVQRTSRGTTYIFKGRGDTSSLEEMHEATQRFDHFLVLAQNDPTVAERLLIDAGTSANEAGFIVAKYARSFRRLHLETRHEFERRRLMLVQQLEAELLDTSEASILPIPADNKPSALFAVVGNTAPVTINMAPTTTISKESNMAIENVISGNIVYTNEDRAIISILSEVKDSVKALQLRSDLDRLKDPAASPEDRRTAVQKLKGFLYSAGRSIGKRIEHIGTEVLIAYLNSLINGK